METEQLYRLYQQHYLVDTDTRTIRKNSLFFALRGDNFNGNKFAEVALEKGARFAIIDDPKYLNGEKTILVKNTLSSLQKLANYHRKQCKIPIIGLTGSNGKTTTKELINSVISTTYKTCATKGNLNNHIGVPLTLLSITPNTEIAIIEMGANHQKEIEFLCKIAEPDYGYITNFGKAHLEGFGGLEGVIKGKSELYHYLKEHNKTCFVNPFDKKQMELTENYKRIFLNSSIHLNNQEPFLTLEWGKTRIQSQLVGVYNFSNILAAISIGDYFNIQKSDIVKGIEKYTPSNNRSQIITTETNHIILDAYNANPTSVEAALDNFNKIQAENKIVILGDMFELGEYSQLEHQKIVDKVSELSLKGIFIGKHFYDTNAPHKYATFEEAANYFSDLTLKNHSLLIKGSRGMALERLMSYF